MYACLLCSQWLTTLVSDVLLSVLLNAYIEMLAAMEKWSIKHGNDSNVSIHVHNQRLPSFNCLQVSKHHDSSFPPGMIPVIDKVANQVCSIFLYVTN